LLMSQAFADRLQGGAEPLGSHSIKGFTEAVPIYRPSRAQGEKRAAWRQGDDSLSANSVNNDK
jgi:class 3 adenylate cyclase